MEMSTCGQREAHGTGLTMNEVLDPGNASSLSEFVAQVNDFPKKSSGSARIRNPIASHISGM